jgi:hypothetical protein
VEDYADIASFDPVIGRHVLIHQSDPVGFLRAAIDLFAAVGLPCPKMFCEVPVGGGAPSPIYAWFAEGIRSVLPQIAQMGMATGDLMPIDSVESWLRAATVGQTQPSRGARPDLRLGNALTCRRRKHRVRKT